MSDFTNRIDTLLTQTQQRRADLCRGTGIPEGTIRNWIKGKTPPIDSAVKVANFFNVSVDWLLTGNEAMKPSFYSDEEQDLVNYYRMLNDRDREYLMFTAKNLVSRAREELKVAEASKPYGNNLV